MSLAYISGAHHIGGEDAERPCLHHGLLVLVPLAEVALALGGEAVDLVRG